MNRGLQGSSQETFRDVDADSSVCDSDTGLNKLTLNLDDLHLNKTPIQLEIGQRAVTFIKNVCTRGTVRYIGDEKDSTGYAHTVVGLELVGFLIVFI